MNSFMKDLETLYDDMTESQKKVANYVVKNCDQIAFLTLDEMANEIGVSTTTVIRFARGLGYNGYSDFLGHIQKMVKAKVSLPERLNVSVNELNHDNLLIKSFNQDASNINATLAGISAEKLDNALNMVVEARNIYVIGLRSSFCLAHYFATCLGQIRENVRLIQAVGSIYPEEILNVAANDLCVAFTFPRNARVTLEIARWMKKEGAKVLAVTDSLLSPIAEYSDNVLACETKGVMFKHSLAGPLSLINYLLAAVAAQDKDKAMKMLSKTEELLRQGHYFGI